MQIFSYISLCSNIKGASGVEPETSSSAVKCSATELYPHKRFHAILTLKLRQSMQYLNCQ